MVLRDDAAACTVNSVEDWKVQMLLWGHAYTGAAPRDRTVLRCEDRLGWVEQTYALWDRDETYFRTTKVNGERPAWWHALVPAIAAGLRPLEMLESNPHRTASPNPPPAADTLAVDPASPSEDPRG